MNKKTTLAVTTIIVAMTIQAGDNLGFDPKIGKVSGRVQSLSMFRNYEKPASGGPGSEYSHSLGVQLDYLSPAFLDIFTVGASYTGVGVIDASEEGTLPPGEGIILNGRMNVLNEAYLKAAITTNTAFIVGRQALNTELFRHTEARQKKRAQEGIFVQMNEISKLKIFGGHTVKMSNIYGRERHPGLSWDYDNYGDVFSYTGSSTKTDGITFLEANYTGVSNLEIALFDAYAWEIANVIGTRAKYSITKETAIEFQYRNEMEADDAPDRNSDVFSLALIQKVGPVSIELGYFGVHGDTLRFEENTTGINHALNYSLLLDSAHFTGGADTAYLKTVAKINKTVFYMLLNRTWQDDNMDNAEVDFVIKQPLTDQITLALKGSVGVREMDTGDNDIQNDGRVFITYKF